MKKICIFFIFTLLFLFSLSPYSYAFRFNIDRPKITLDIKPGEKSVGFITVDNYGYNQDLDVRVYVQDVIYLPDGTNDFVPKGSTKWSLADWIKVEPTSFKLRGDSSQMIRYLVRVPPEAQGGRYGVVFFEVRMPFEPSSNRRAPSSSARIGSIFVVTAKGTEYYEGGLTGLKADVKDGSLIANCIIRSDSNVLMRPMGDFIIMNREGKEIAKKEINPSKGGVLPATSRSFEVEWKADEIKLEKDTDYILQVTFDYGGESLLGGQTYFKVE